MALRRTGRGDADVARIRLHVSPVLNETVYLCSNNPMMLDRSRSLESKSAASLEQALMGKLDTVTGGSEVKILFLASGIYA